MIACRESGNGESPIESFREATSECRVEVFSRPDGYPPLKESFLLSGL